MPCQWEAAYQDERNKLIDGEQDYSKSYDKYVLTLSGGALALSMTFIHDIIGDDAVRVRALIVLAWIAFTLSVAATLFSINQSAPLYRTFRDILDRKAEHAGDKFSWTEVRDEQNKCRRLKLMDWLNYGGLVLFLSGVILLLSFITYNLRGATPVTDETQPQPKDVNEDVKPAAAPVDGNPPTGSPVPDGKAGKPAVAPVSRTPDPTASDKLVELGKPALAPVSATPPKPPTVSPDPDGKAGKPALAPVDVAPPTEPAPSEPAPSPPPEDKE